MLAPDGDALGFQIIPPLVHLLQSSENVAVSILLEIVIIIIIIISILLAIVIIIIGISIIFVWTVYKWCHDAWQWSGETKLCNLYCHQLWTVPKHHLSIICNHRHHDPLDDHRPHHPLDDHHDHDHDQHLCSIVASSWLSSPDISFLPWWKNVFFISFLSKPESARECFNLKKLPMESKSCWGSSCKASKVCVLLFLTCVIEAHVHLPMLLNLVLEVLQHHHISLWLVI